MPQTQNCCDYPDNKGQRPTHTTLICDVCTNIEILLRFKTKKTLGTKNVYLSKNCDVRSLERNVILTYRHIRSY